MLKTREQPSAEDHPPAINRLKTTGQLYYGTPGTSLARRYPGILFITGSKIQPSKLQLAAQLAKRDSSLLVALMPRMNLSQLIEAENLRLMLRFCDTIIIVDSTQELSGSYAGLTYSNIIPAICEGLQDASCRKPLRRMLTRGQLARVSAANSSNVEKALLIALRKLLPVAEFSHKPQVFLSIVAQEVDRKTLVRASRWISALRPSHTIIRSNPGNGQVTASVYLFVTGIAFPHSPSSRKFSMDIDELEPESAGDDEMEITLGLDQME